MVAAKSKYQEELEKTEWDRAAWIAFWIPKFSSSAPRRFVEYNPLRSDSKQTDILALLDSIERNRKRLPKKLPPGELKRKFDKWIEKTGGEF